MNHITTLLTLFLLLLTLYNTYKTISTNKLLYSHIYNNTKTKLIRVLTDETEELSIKTEYEKALIRYFGDKLETVYKNYEYVKSTNSWSIIFTEQFKIRFLGDGRLELLNQYDYFPQEFLDKINNINEADFEQFKTEIQHELLSYYSKDEMLSVLKTHTIGVFKKNIRKILKLYLDTRHLIQDKDYIKTYPELFKENDSIIIEDIQETAHLKMYTKASYNKNRIEELISDGVEGLEDALNLLNSLSNISNKYRIEIILLQNRLQTYLTSIRTGQEMPKEEYNRIVKSTLEILNKL